MSLPQETAIHVADPATSQTRIRDELFAAVCARLPAVVCVEASVVTVLIVSLLWDITSPLQMAIWVSTHFVIVILHGYVYLSFRTKTAELSRLEWILPLTYTIAGFYWSALLGTMFVVATVFLYQLYPFLFMGAVGAIALVLASENLPTFVGFTAPPTLILSGMAIATWEPRYLTTAFLTVSGMLALFFFAYRRRRDIVAALALRFAQIELTRQLQEQRDAAQRANIGKSKFLAAASHDLRQPLHALSLLTEALQSTRLDEQSRSIADDMRTAVDSLEKMFGALLDMSRLDAGVLHPERRHFSLDDFLQRLADEYATLASAKGLRVAYDRSGHAAFTDPMLLERIVRNYLANAVRYTQSGTIRIEARLTDRSVRIAVIDTGIGIARELHDDIFSEFYQVGNPERDRAKGLGLGLAIVRRIADLLNHPIGVESMLHSGSKFSVTVPLGDPLQLVESAAPAPIPHNISGLRVLVIDDDASVRESMRTLLSLWNCRVALAENAEDGVAAALSVFDRPDALIVDLRLRESKSGIDVITQLRARFRSDIPALIVTGDTAPERLREVADSGQTMVQKPIQPAVLRSFLSSARNYRPSDS